MLEAKPAGLSFEAANPRHAHEWEDLGRVAIPPDKILIPGVIDTKTNLVEHPRLVAQRLERFAEDGLLLVKGPNRMLGYLGQPRLTAHVMSDGWYITGDVGSMDQDGFIRITDRLSRFSKIGGEMVPHVKIEEMINAILGNAAAVVTSVPDEQKGEKLVVFYSQNGADADDIWKKLNQTELPKLWIPKRENFFPIETIPVLGSGKVDLKSIKRLALEKTADSKP